MYIYIYICVYIHTHVCPYTHSMMWTSQTSMRYAWEAEPGIRTSKYSLLH